MKTVRGSKREVGKREPSASKVEITQVVLPNDTNPLGSMLGGRVMHWIDIAGAIAAHRHSRRYVVTAAVDHLDFQHPIRMGQLILLKAVVTRSFHSSMEVEVQVYREDVLTGERKQTSSAFLTYVALDLQGHPTQVPQLIPQTRQEQDRFVQALGRRRRRLSLRRKHQAGFEPAEPRSSGKSA
jgi:acyl-CoA hydrolase